MKKYIIFSALFSLGILNFNDASAQDSKSTPIVNTISSKIKSSTGIRAKFVMSYYDSKNVKKSSVNGQLKIKGDSYAIEMSTHKIYCDGNDVINYLVNSKEVQLSKYNRNDLLTPTQLFNAQLQSNFKYKYISSTTVSGKSVNVIEFTPIKSNKSVKNMHLFVDASSNTIIGGKLFDNKGGYYYYTLSDVNMNSSLKPSDFSFNYKALNGVEVVDLR